MTRCPICNELHDFGKCPLFGTKEEYLSRAAPMPPAPPLPVELPPEKPRVSGSLARTQFEDIFGRGAEGLLQYVHDNPAYSPDQQTLALLVLAGHKKIEELDLHDREVLDRIALQLATSPSDSGGARAAQQAARERHLVPGTMLHKDVEVDAAEHPDYERGLMDDAILTHPEYGSDD
jgi:hypothetical protein